MVIEKHFSSNVWQEVRRKYEKNFAGRFLRATVNTKIMCFIKSILHIFEAPEMEGVDFCLSDDALL